MTKVQMSSKQQQIAYQLAVESSLVAFYQKGHVEAKRLVTAWWGRLSPSLDIQSEMFLHPEALATAADLARTREVLLTDEVRGRYQEILVKATKDAAVQHHKSEETVKHPVALKQMAR